MRESGQEHGTVSNGWAICGHKGAHTGAIYDWTRYTMERMQQRRRVEESVRGGKMLDQEGKSSDLQSRRARKNHPHPEHMS